MWALDQKEGAQPKNWCFQLWCWRRLLRVPWTARKSNQSILKETYPEYSLEGLMLMLKLKYFGHLMQTADSLEKTLMLGKIEGKRRESQRIRWLDSITDSMDINLSRLWEIVKDRETWHAAATHGVAKSWTWLSDWKTTTIITEWPISENPASRVVSIKLKHLCLAQRSTLTRPTYEWLQEGRY